MNKYRKNRPYCPVTGRNRLRGITFNMLATARIAGNLRAEAYLLARLKDASTSGKACLASLDR